MTTDPHHPNTDYQEIQSLHAEPPVEIAPSMYYYIKAWLEADQEYENVIVQSPQQSGVPGALETFWLYLRKIHSTVMVPDRDYFIEEVTLLDLPLILREEVNIRLSTGTPDSPPKELSHE